MGVPGEFRGEGASLSQTHFYYSRVPSDNRLGGTQDQILDFYFEGRTEKVTKWHQHAFPGLILGAFLHFSSRIRLEGSLGQVGPESGREIDET